MDIHKKLQKEIKEVLECGYEPVILLGQDAMNEIASKEDQGKTLNRYCGYPVVLNVIYLDMCDVVGDK